jgi:hypothetical protein
LLLGSGVAGAVTRVPVSPERQRLIGQVVRLASVGMPCSASRIARRHRITFNPDTVRRWRGSGGPMATFAWCLTELDTIGRGDVAKAERKSKAPVPAPHGGPPAPSHGRPGRRKGGVSAGRGRGARPVPTSRSAAKRSAAIEIRSALAERSCPPGAFVGGSAAGRDFVGANRTGR